MPVERWERRQLGNSSWVLGQPKPGAVPRKSEVIWRRGSDVTSSILSKAAPTRRDHMFEGGRTEKRQERWASEAFLPVLPQMWEKNLNF